MKEFSEKELEELYKDVKLQEIPSMWEDIERNLAPKKPRKVLKFRYYASAAAVVLVLLLAVPVLQNIRKADSGENLYNSSGGAAYDAGTSDSSAPESAEYESAGMEYPEEMIGQDAAPSEAGAEESTEETMEGDVADPGSGATGKYDENVSAENATDKAGEASLQLEIEVWAVQETREGLVITALVTDSGDSSYREQTTLTILYEGTAYRAADISGTFRVKLVQEEKNLKLLEILP